MQLVDEHPRDWSSINALGDLYVRAGDHDAAVTQFTRVAEHFFKEGFLPKATALYKKTLKIRSNHEDSLIRLSEIASQQGLLTDAKQYLRQLADVYRARGNAAGADACAARFAELVATSRQKGSGAKTVTAMPKVTVPAAVEPVPVEAIEPTPEPDPVKPAAPAPVQDLETVFEQMRARVQADRDTE